MKFLNLKFLRKIIKYGSVGILGTIIDIGVTHVLLANFNVNPIIASVSGFLLGASNNFVLNKFWTFKEPLKNEEHSLKLPFLHIRKILKLQNNIDYSLFQEFFFCTKISNFIKYSIFQTFLKEPLKNNSKKTQKQAIIFLIISLIGLSLNTMIFNYTYTKIGFVDVVSKIIASGIVFVWNFLANYFITFREN